MEKNPGIPDKDQLLCFTGAKQFEDVFADIGHKFNEKLFHMQLHYFRRKKNELDLTKRYLKMNVHIFGNSVFVLVTVKIIF